MSAPITLHRVGDFYEAFGDDAKIVAATLDIALTMRVRDGERRPMCGIPAHGLESALAQLESAGVAMKVAS